MVSSIICVISRGMSTPRAPCSVWLQEGDAHWAALCTPSPWHDKLQIVHINLPSAGSRHRLQSRGFTAGEIASSVPSCWGGTSYCPLLLPEGSLHCGDVLGLLWQRKPKVNQ